MSCTTDSATGFVPCLNPATLTGTGLEAFVRLAAAAGFPAVELSIQQVVTQEPEKTRDILAEHGIAVAAASGILPAGPVLPAPLLVDDAAYAACLEGLAERLAAFATVGCPTATIVLNPRSSRDTNAALAVAAERLGHLARAADEHAVQLAVEVVGVTQALDTALGGANRVARTIPQLQALLERVDRENVTVLVDSFHWAATGSDLLHLAGLGAFQIGHVQIADVPPGVPYGAYSDEMRLFPGDGPLDWGAFGEALNAHGYSGAVSVELFNPELRRIPDPEIAARAHRAATECWAAKQVAP